MLRVSCPHNVLQPASSPCWYSYTPIGHILHFNLSDAPDISHKLHDLVMKAYYVLVTFPYVGPRILTKLFQFYCNNCMVQVCGWSHHLPYCNIVLKLHLTNLILCKIWRLPRHSHTGIVHSVANLFNVVFLHSQRLMLSVTSCSSLLARQIFSGSCSLCYSFSGYNYSMFGHRHLKMFKTKFVQEFFMHCTTVLAAWILNLKRRFIQLPATS